jgi:hypothetical protein
MLAFGTMTAAEVARQLARAPSRLPRHLPGGRNHLGRRPPPLSNVRRMVVAMCRTGTMTGQTIVIDAGRVFH